MIIIINYYSDTTTKDNKSTLDIRNNLVQECAMCMLIVLCVGEIKG